MHPLAWAYSTHHWLPLGGGQEGLGQEERLAGTLGLDTADAFSSPPLPSHKDR